jgi:two-component sensor histidine kinase
MPTRSPPSKKKAAEAAKQEALEAALESADKLRRHMRIIVDVGRLASQQLDLNRFFDQAVVQVARAVEINHVKILQYRRQTGDLLQVAGIGWKEGVVGTATFSTALRSPAGRAYQTGEPVVITDTGDTAEFTISPVLKEHGIVSLANVPILVDGAAWGVLEVDSSTPRDFSADTLNFMTAAAATAGTVIRRFQAAEREAEAIARASREAQQRQELLTEMQHRVKNNFQIILSMIALQRRRIDEKPARRVLDHVANRINAISLAHDQLNPTQGLSQSTRLIDLSAYLRALCSNIEQQLENITIEVQADEIELLIDRAVPVGLIVNETITNSAKHAFSPEGGAVTVRLVTGVGVGEARLIVSDNGQGVDPSRPQGSGTRLIASLAAQVGGQVEQESSEKGTTTTVQFPIIT